jgi:hypothetical protein
MVETHPPLLVAPAGAKRISWRAAGALGLIAASFLGGSLWHALESPGETIRNELAAAAADMQSMPADVPPAQLEREIRRHFRGHDVTVDPAGFPTRVAVTVHGLDRADCADTVAAAQRIEGLAVVQLDGYASAKECRVRNDMRWEILP